VGEGDETPAAFAALVRGVPDDVVLVESDMNVAGEEMDARMEDIVRRICKIKGWGLEEGVLRLGRNWRAFVFGEE
jgi:Tat protein secretion system quality control protein TatD with DNase activity